MIVASRPMDLLPSSGFWYKMAHADLFDLRIFDPIRPQSPQSRVMMRGSWASIPIVTSVGSPLSDVRILPLDTPRVLSEMVIDRYQHAKHWKRRGPQVLDIINSVHTDHLWQFNLQLILGIREMLDIRTPVSIGRYPLGRGGAGIASIMDQYGATSFLSGTAGKAYTGDDESYTDSEIHIVWSPHRPVTADSILSVLMDHDDPLAVVMAEIVVPQSSRVPVGQFA